MNIQDALKGSGKATTKKETAGYVALGEDEILYWFDRLKDEKLFAVKLKDVNHNDWIPYPTKEDIRPERAGELWVLSEHDGIRSRKCLIVNSNGVLKRVWDDACAGSLSSDQIHNQNGWTLIYSPDEEVMKDLEGREVCCLACRSGIIDPECGVCMDTIR